MSQWLPVEASAQLDIAYCSHLMRSRYLELLANSAAVDFAVVSYGEVEFGRMRWMVERKVRGSDFAFFAGSLSAEDEQTIAAYIRMSANCLKTVCISAENRAATITVLQLLANICVPHITKLELLSCNLCEYRLCDDTLLDLGAVVETILRNSAASLEYLTLQCAVLHVLEGVGLPALKYIQLSGCDDAPLHIIGSVAAQLQSIKLDESCCTGAGLAAIAQHCTGLQSVEINGAWEPQEFDDFDEGLAALVKTCTNLTHLCMQGCYFLTDVGMYAIATHSTRLEDLTLFCNDITTDALLIALAHSSSARTLQAVHLKWCDALIGACVVELATHCTSLLNLSASLRGEFLAHLKLAIPNLSCIRKLDISHLPVDNTVLQLIAEYIPRIEELNVGRGIGDAAEYSSPGFGAIAIRCEKLRILNLCPSSNDEGKLVETLWKQLRPGLAILYV